MDHGVAAHRVADERDPVRLDLVDDGDDVVTEGREGPVRTAHPRLAMAPEVDRYDPAPFGQVVDLVRPIATVARPAMHERHHRSVIGAVSGIGDLHAVAA